MALKHRKSDIFGYLGVLWEQKISFTATFLVVLALFGVVGNAMQTKYTASMIVAPISSSSQSSFPEQAANLLSLGGVSGLDFRGSSQFDQFIEVLDTYPVAERLVDRHDLYVAFGLARRGPSGELQRPGGMGAFMSDVLSRAFGGVGWKTPTPYDVAQYLERNLQIVRLPRSLYYELRIEHQDSAFATTFLRDLHRSADAFLQEDDKNRVSAEALYLARRLDEVVVGEHRAALANLLADRERKLMLLETNLSYAARVIQAPVTTDRPTSPNALLLAIGALAIASLAASLAAVGKSEWLP